MLKKLFKKKFDVIVIGGATRDFFFETNAGKIIKDKTVESGKLLAFEYEAKVVPDNVHFAYGGGAINVSSAFARLGLRTAALVNIGKEGTGDLVLQKLKEEGVNTSLVTRDPEFHTALSVIISQKSDHTTFTYRGANNYLKIKNWAKLKSTGWIYISSLSGESEEILKKMPEFLKKTGIKLAWNPGFKQLEKGYSFMKDVLKVTEVLILNKAEAKQLIESRGKSLKDLADNEEILKSLKETGPKIIVVTDAGNGSFAFDNNKKYYVKSVASSIKETTGAGDAYGSTFVASLIKGFQVQEAMDLASKNAASVISKTGGAQEGLLTGKELFKKENAKSPIF
ncbi:MAG: carbohydrate kinase family protein [Patescibacteria group bacterium]|nr:carbohydrate kinase family protein [Patescibacteria group bacterium]MCL5093652.1 carbohydrate kinase family protein [Patescibacteria group bacterium]